MNSKYEQIKQGADKIVLLILFVLSLVMAQSIVSRRSSIHLSQPIELAYSGLSVPIPIGKSWQSEKKWQHSDNAFILRSSLAPVQGKAIMQVEYQYFLTARKISSDKWLEYKANEIEGVVIKRETIKNGVLTFEWSYIQSSQTSWGLAIATAKLPNNRQLDIQLYQSTCDCETSQGILESMIKQISLEKNDLLDFGTDIVEQVKNIGIERILNTQSRQDYFFIKDSTNRKIGFTMDAFLKAKTSDDLTIQLAHYLFLRGTNAQEKAATFQCDSNLEEFSWRAENNYRFGKISNEIILSDANAITVRSSDRRTREREYIVGPAAIPYILLEVVISQMLADSRKKIMIDTIEDDGTVVPTVISLFEDSELPQDSSYAFKIEFIDGKGTYEEFFLNNQLEVIKKLVYQQSVFVLEQADVNDVLNEFPERADFILNKSEILENNRL